MPAPTISQKLFVSDCKTTAPEPSPKNTQWQENQMYIKYYS